MGYEAVPFSLRELLDNYPLIHLGNIDANMVASTILLMMDQKEYLREVRFVRFDHLKEEQIYGMYTR
jgi:hypothetical protein